MKKHLLLFVVLFAGVFASYAQPINNEDGIRYYHSPPKDDIDWVKKGVVGIPQAPLDPPVGQIRPIAKFEPAEGVLVRYPFGVPLNLIAKMSQDVTVITIVANSSQQSTVLSQYNANGVNVNNCKFLIANTNTYWTRDYGPWFMAVNNSSVGMFDFNYNRIKFGHNNTPRVLDNAINTKLAPFLSSTAGGGIPIERYGSSLYLTGGNYMNDGIKQGFSTTLVLNENTEYTTPALKDVYNQYLGIEQYHFIPDPIYNYDAIQHIDCWAKLLAPDKVLIAKVPEGTRNYLKFEAAADSFALCTSSYGTPMKVFRVNERAIDDVDYTNPYTNSLILNNKVYVPLSGTSTPNDAAALEVYKQAMPGYEIIGISDATMGTNDKWKNTDALHCRTHEIADRCMLYIKHQPLLGDIDNNGPITFSTELYSYCNKTIDSDSAIVYIKSNGGEFVGYNMSKTGLNSWETTVSLPEGSVEYYIFAADESGRRECHPYIGAPDPHKFNLIGNAPNAPVLTLNKTTSSVILDGITLINDTIKISNLGTAELEFQVADIDFPVKFTVTPDEGTLQTNNSQFLILTYDFNNAKSEEFTGTFKLKSNDPLKPEVEITLHATVFAPLAPVLSLDKTSSKVTSEALAVIEDTITISNTGTAELTFEITALDFHDMLTLSPLSGVLQPNKSQMIILSYDFANVENGEYTGSFKLLSNDLTQQEVEISLYAYQKYVGIKETNHSTTQIYPNPASDKINIVYHGENSTKANIYNILGVQLKESVITKGINTIDIKALPKGIYFIKIEGKAFKFVKQ